MNFFLGLVEFFLGTPRRAFRTVVGTLVVLVIVSDSFRNWLIGETIEAVGAILPLALVGGIIVWAFRTMLGPVFPGNRRR